MISPGAKIARDARRAALEGNGVQGPGTPAMVQVHQVTEDVRQGHLGGGHPSPQQQVGGGHPSPTQASGSIRHVPQQTGGGVRQDHPQRGGESLDQSTTQDPSAVEEAAKEAEAITANRALRIAIEATILVKQIQVEAIYPQILDEVVLAGSIGREILMDMLKEATGGANPGPGEGDDMRNFTQNDVLELAARLVAKKKLAQEAIQANAEAETAAHEATKNAEQAARLAQSATDEQARLVEEIRLAVEKGQNEINTSRDARSANAPSGSINFPAQVDQIPTLAPIIHAVIPEIVPRGGLTASGEPLLGPREAARLAVEQERVRVLKYQEDLMERREIDEVKYDPAYDYSFLSICKQGEYSINSKTSKNHLVTQNSQGKVSVNRNRARADSCTCPGLNVSEPSRCTNSGIERGMLRTIPEVNVNINALKTCN